MTHTDKVVYDTQFVLNNFHVVLLDRSGRGLDERGSDMTFVEMSFQVFRAIDVQTRAELEVIMALIFGAVLDHRDHAGTGSTMALLCADAIHMLKERCPEFRERDAETGTEVGKMRFFDGISNYGG